MGHVSRIVTTKELPWHYKSGVNPLNAIVYVSPIGFVRAESDTRVGVSIVGIENTSLVTSGVPLS